MLDLKHENKCKSTVRLFVRSLLSALIIWDKWRATSWRFTRWVIQDSWSHSYTFRKTQITRFISTNVQYFDWLLWRFELWRYIYKHHNCFRWFNLSPVLRNIQNTVIRFWLARFRTCYDFLVDVIFLGNSATGHSIRKYSELPSRFSTKYHENAIFLTFVWK